MLDQPGDRAWAGASQVYVLPNGLGLKGLAIAAVERVWHMQDSQGLILA
jgi:hypothetical protein